MNFLNWPNISMSLRSFWTARPYDMSHRAALHVPLRYPFLGPSMHRSTTHLYRSHHYIRTVKDAPTTKPSFPAGSTNTSHDGPPLPSFNLFHAIRDSHPAVRYTVYAGLGLMATAESTFWFHIIKAKFFPSASEDEQKQADQILGNLREAIASYKANWMGNYWRYYGGYVWGVGER
jgi:hypothetical protein